MHGSTHGLSTLGKHTLTQKPIQDNTLFGGSATASGNTLSGQFLLNNVDQRYRVPAVLHCDILIERQSFIALAVRPSGASWWSRVGFIFLELSPPFFKSRRFRESYA